MTYIPAEDEAVLVRLVVDGKVVVVKDADLKQCVIGTQTEIGQHHTADKL